jgi:hypothetical protein
LSFVAANAQQGKWAATNDQTAKSLIDMERQWAEASMGFTEKPSVLK